MLSALASAAHIRVPFRLFSVETNNADTDRAAPKRAVQPQSNLFTIGQEFKVVSRRDGRRQNSWFKPSRHQLRLHKTETLSDRLTRYFTLQECHLHSTQAPPKRITGSRFYIIFPISKLSVKLRDIK